MKKYLLLVTLLVLTGCTKSLPTSFAPENLYKGYPCQDHCSEFQQGYEMASANQLTQNEQCKLENLNSNTGCKAYLSDFRYQNSADLILE